MPSLIVASDQDSAAGGGGSSIPNPLEWLELRVADEKAAVPAAATWATEATRKSH